jgi:NADH dehydrogenase/NADH:ubiquinone oxidoreductase subunit G
MTRCILCYRCVYTADQVSKERDHGVLDRGDHSQIATFIQNNLDNEFIGNVIDVCPVGALTDRTFRFKKPGVVHQAHGCASRLPHLHRNRAAVDARR